MKEKIDAGGNENEEKINVTNDGSCTGNEYFCRLRV